MKLLLFCKIFLQSATSSHTPLLHHQSIMKHGWHVSLVTSHWVKRYMMDTSKLRCVTKEFFQENSFDLSFVNCFLLSSYDKNVFCLIFLLHLVSSSKSYVSNHLSFHLYLILTPISVFDIMTVWQLSFLGIVLHALITLVF